MLRDHEEEKQQVDAAVAKKLCKMMSAHHLHLRSDGHGIIEANNWVGASDTFAGAKLENSVAEKYHGALGIRQRASERASEHTTHKLREWIHARATAPAHSQTECVVCVLVVCECEEDEI